jgi:ABC-type transport system involved in cytochrome c biogenesis ATPase subunit
MPVQTILSNHSRALAELDGLQIVAGLNAVCGDEGRGKTRFLRQLSMAHPQAFWLDLKLPAHDEHTPEEVWQIIQSQWPQWHPTLCQDLSEALNLQEHLGKKLFMLSAGSRRKVGLVGLLASGAQVTCLDQPYVALDMASIQVLRDFLEDVGQDPSRAWVVADYEADPHIEWQNLIDLDQMNGLP